MYKTIPIRVKFTEEEKAFWVDQCQRSNSLINCAIYHTRQTHYARLSSMDNAFTTYWVGDELRPGWKTYKCTAAYPELDKVLKGISHYKAQAAQAAQQTLQTVGESINSYNKLVDLYYQGEVDRPSLPRYRKKGGLAAVTFPKQALIYKNGCFYPSISKGTKPELITEISLALPEFIDADWVREVRIRPSLGEFWIDWVIDDGQKPINLNPNLDYTQAIGFDHGGTNWLTGVSTHGKSLIIDGRKLKSMNQGYCRLVAKYKQGKSEFYWDGNLDRIQRKRNNQMRDAINKAARFIINQCLNDRMGNLVIGWNEQQKNRPDMGKRNNQNFVAIPTGRLIERLKQLCPEYGIVLTITEEANTSCASFLDGDSLPKHGEKPATWKASGKRIKRGLYRTKLGYLVNADANAAANIIRKVATQLGISPAEVGRASLAVPQRIDLFTKLSKSYRKKALISVYERPLINILLESPAFQPGEMSRV
ncbi:MAG: transposase [Phormidium sp.]